MTSAPAISTNAPALRDIAHELRQPLGTIEAIAYYLGLVLPRDDAKILEHLDRLQQLVEQSNWILQNGLNLTDMPSPTPVRLDLEEIISQAISSRSPAPWLEWELTGALPLVYADPSLAQALIENLLMLFRQISSESSPATLQTSTHARGALLEIHAPVAGYKSAAALGPGAAMSLESARRMAEAQGGSLDIEVDPAAGVALKLVLPGPVLP